MNHYLINTKPNLQQLEIYQHLTLEKSKNVITAVTLALCFGMFGAHKFYQKKLLEGVFYLVFSWTLIPLFFALLDLFFIPGQIRWSNQQAALRNLLQTHPELTNDIAAVYQAHISNHKVEIILKLIFGILLSWLIYVSGSTFHERHYFDKSQLTRWLK
jgi:TM2 domain-containing membrane protein YozV